jgi:hypothetical protein
MTSMPEPEKENAALTREAVLKAHLANSWARISTTAAFTQAEAADLLWEDFPLLRAAAQDFDEGILPEELLDDIMYTSIRIGPEDAALIIRAVGIALLLAEP